MSAGIKANNDGSAAIQVGGVDRVSLTDTGNVGVGTSAPIRKLTVAQSTSPEFVLQETSGATDAKNWRIFNSGNKLYFGTLNDAGSSGTDTVSVTSTGLLQFNSGYGSVATAYGCRAWVNFNGTGTVSIRASGNVSSITDNGVGDYTVNFTTALPDANYAAVVTAQVAAGSASRNNLPNAEPLTVSTVRLRVISAADGSLTDQVFVLAAIFR